MSIFSEVLSELIQQKEIKVFSMVKYCHLDRSTMYKIINGKRNPPAPDVYKKMTDFMRLTPTENQRLTEAWKITRMGSETYYKRKSVENLICHFPSALPTPPLNYYINSQNDPGEAGEKNCIALSSRQHMNYFLHRMFLEEAGKKDGNISLFMQADYDFLFSLLSSLKPSGTLKVQHILCMSSKTQFTSENEVYNLQCLKKIFPLYMTELKYTVWYFYDEIQSHFYNFNLFPYMILTTEAAILCSSDYQEGIYFQDKDIVNMLRKIYLSCREKCSPLFEAVQIRPENCVNIFSALFRFSYQEETMIGIQPEACLTPFLAGGILDDIFNREIDNGSFILSQGQKAFECSRQKISKNQFFLYFTLPGLVHFARTGLVEEIPEIFYRPLTLSQRIMVLQNVLTCCQTGTYRILEESLSYLPQNLHLCICGGEGSILFRENNGHVVFLLIKESGLLDTFRDYLEHMEDSSFYKPEEAAFLVNNVIEKLKKELP